MTIEILEEKETRTEPAKRWRNRYWVSEEYDVCEGTATEEGETPADDVPDGVRKLRVGHFEGCLWPSKDVAETVAAAFIEGEPIEYLGAFPVLD